MTISIGHPIHGRLYQFISLTQQYFATLRRLDVQIHPVGVAINNNYRYENNILKMSSSAIAGLERRSFFTRAIPL